jgi:hypothetical protein
MVGDLLAGAVGGWLAFQLMQANRTHALKLE